MTATLLPPSFTRSPNQSLTPITAQVNASGHLEIGGCDVVDLAELFGTPLYIVDEQTLRQGCQAYQEAFARYYPQPVKVLYATKAWNCLALCALMIQSGLGLDVASGGELYTALQAGAAAEDIYLHGNAKSAAELEMALEAGCTVVVDHSQELTLLAQLAAQREQQARILVRVNPGIDVHTHEYIRTGQIDSKFGIGLGEMAGVLEQIRALPQINLVGLHAHIGSQIFDLQGHQDLGGIFAQLWGQAQQAGLTLSELNVGGGLGIRYVESDDPPSIEAWVQAVCQGVQQGFTSAGLKLPRLLCEPGRSLLGPAAVTAYRVGGSKQIPASPDLPQGRTYVSLDGGMSDNPRPITYQAIYTPLSAHRPQAEPTQTVTLAGKHCESGDLVIKEAHLPELNPGDVLVVLATGAYTYSMASNYNRYPRAAAVLVHQGQAEVIIRRETYGDLIRQDVVPSHLQGGMLES